MNDEALLGPWVRRFLLEHVVAERNLARNTQHGYRDALCQLIPFVAKQSRKPIERLAIIDISAELVRLFLAYLEASRGCGIPTRNQRLTAIRALARSLANTARSISNGPDRSARSLSRRPCRLSFPISKKRRSTPCWRRRIGEQHKVGATTFYCYSSTTLGPGHRKSPTRKSPIWT
jgi:hypothetical protein